MPPDVAIRPFQESDAPELYEAIRESIEDLRPWMPWCHPQYAISETEEWIQKQISAFREGSELAFAIVSGDGRIAGGCGLNGINRANQKANLGYWVRSSNCKQGIATKATRLLADWAFRNTDLNRLEILVAVNNHASLRVAAKAGAVREGVLRGRLRLQDEAHDAVMFSILRSDR